jgi:hypothetical protein
LDRDDKLSSFGDTPSNASLGIWLNNMSADSSLPCRYFFRRTLILGSSIFVASLLSGIAMVFWRERGDSLFTMPAPLVYRLLIQATLGPLYMGLAFVWPVTLLVMFVLTLIVLVGSQLRRMWLMGLAFVLMGFYWLWLVKLIADGAFD